jgi:hypothetical protein
MGAQPRTYKLGRSRPVSSLIPQNTQPVSVNIKQYVVGKPGEKGGDFTYEEMEQMILDMAKWWARPESGKKYADPLQMARLKMRECLLGLKQDGTSWNDAPQDFRKRVKVKCNYDIKAKKGVPVKLKKVKLDPIAQQGASQVNGMRPLATKINVEETRAKYVADIMDVFPELDNAAHRPNVESLADIYAQRRVISAELELGVGATARGNLLEQLKTIETMADSMMNKLGIHPNQIRKKVAEDDNSSVADLVAQISEDEEFRAREKQWALQLALQLWWMSNHHNYAKDGPNIHDWEVWHMTRSRPIRFTCKCKRETLLVEGFEPHELRDYLLKEGVLVEEPVLPEIINKDALVGLSTFQPEAVSEEAHTG